MLIFCAILTILSPADRHTIGYVQTTGEVQDASRSVVGWMRRKGDEYVIEDRSHRIVGYAHVEGRLFDASHRLIGYMLGARHEDASGRLVERLDKLEDFQTRVAWTFFFMPKPK